MSTVAAPRPPAALADAWLATGPMKLLINGEWCHAQSGKQIAANDPATGQQLTQLADAGPADIDSAVGAARAALTSPSWAGLTGSARGQLLWRIAETIAANADQLAELETLDQGKTLRTGRFAEIPGAVEQFRYYAGLASKISGISFTPSISYQPQGTRVMAYTTAQPVGVVAAIVPWNSPLLMACMKLAPALAAGCTVVLKPAEDTSLTAIRLGEILLEAGLPAGVVNVLTGDGAVGAALARHPEVDKITFTGSTEVGKKLVAAAAGRMTRLTLELGGKSPAIVLADADLELTIPGLARGIFTNSGQVCVAGSRIYVARASYAEVLDRLIEHVDGITLGHGLDPASDLGPLVHAAHARHVQSYLDDAAAAGAQVHQGGTTETGSAFLRPAVITEAQPDSALMREEIFGPVAAITPFDDLDEVVQLANDTRYGLAASVWTQNLSAAHRVAGAIQAGTVWINCHSYFSPELIKGGHKESGWGYENGLPGLQNYLESKTVCMVV